ncbi:hypothetical protein CX648_19680 [Aeromonas dhakensis]|nr:hypothetical protein CX648_19680 [Aeromonas dhakensis]
MHQYGQHCAVCTVRLMYRSQDLLVQHQASHPDFAIMLCQKVKIAHLAQIANDLTRLPVMRTM